MISVRVYNLCFVVVLFCFIHAIVLRGKENTVFDISDRDIFSLDLPDLDLFEVADSSLSMRQVSPESIVSLLITQADILDILQENIFLHTNKLNHRSLLDRVLFDDNRNVWDCDRTLFVMHIFGSYMPRSNFTSRSTDIDSYVALQQNSLIFKLQNVVDRLIPLFQNPIFNIDINKILGLFKNLTVQERQIGLFFEIGKLWDTYRFTVQFPVYYLERNFSLTEEEQILIEAELGRTDIETQEDLTKNHMVSDKLGLGDSRVQFDVLICETPKSIVYGGFYTTLPTAFPFVKGIVGTTFPKPCTYPSFNLTELFDLAITPTQENQEKAFDILTDFLLGALDRLSANLLDQPLGNGGHVGLGTYLTVEMPLGQVIKNEWFDIFMTESKLSLEYLIPKKEKRFFINKIDVAAFNPSNFIDPNSPIIDPVEAAENLAFLESQIVERLYLRAFPVTVQPGPIFRYTAKVMYNGLSWCTAFGYDLWIQGAEHDSRIKNKIIQNQVCFDKVHPPLAYQSKIFGTLGYMEKEKDSCLVVSLNGEATISNRGIGSDWAVSFCIEKLF